jgi:dihydroneopterin aldolase
MDKIQIKGLEIFAYHGVNPEEKENGQPFLLDITLWADLSRARRSDDLNDTVNYAAVRKTVQRVFTAEKYNLIERAAQAVCDGILGEHPQVEEVRVTLKKPEAPMNAVFDYVAVEVAEARPKGGGGQ